MESVINNLNRDVAAPLKWVFYLPQEITVYAGDFGISVSWVEVPFDSVYYKLSDGPWVEATVSSGGGYEYFALTPATGTYTIGLRFNLGTDYREIAIPGVTVTQPTEVLPSAPLNIIGYDLADGTVEVTWEAPANLASCNPPVTGYTVNIMLNGVLAKNTTVVGSTATNVIISMLDFTSGTHVTGFNAEMWANDGGAHGVSINTFDSQVL
jgi:hypothetical protein